MPAQFVPNVPFPPQMDANPNAESIMTTIEAALDEITAEMGPKSASRLVQRFTTAEVRDAVIPAPTAGMLCVVNGELQVSLPAVGWRPAVRRIGGSWSGTTSVPSGALTLLTFQSESADTDSMASMPATSFTIPEPGVWAISAVADGLGAAGSLRIVVGGELVDAASSVFSGRSTASFTAPQDAGTPINVRAYQTNGSAATVTVAANLHAYRVSL